jgi:hypothetical protein
MRMVLPCSKPCVMDHYGGGLAQTRVYTSARQETDSPPVHAWAENRVLLQLRGGIDRQERR